MSETTPNNALPFPTDSDVPNAPSQLKALAEALDTLKWGSRNLKPLYGIKEASASPSPGKGSFADIAGTTLEITPAVASVILISAVFDIETFNSLSAVAATVNLDGTDQSRVAKAKWSGGGHGTVAQNYALSLSAAKHTIKLRAKEIEEGAGSIVYSPGTGFTYWLLAA